MAERNRYTCTSCEEDFAFKSKYRRHLQTKAHKWNEELTSCHQHVVSSNATGNSGEDHSVELNADKGGSSSDCDYDYDTDTVEQDKESSCWSDVEDLMDIETRGSDFTPFANKIEALLFMMINAPQPIGETNLKFIFHAIKMIDQSVPSVDALKRLVLPGFTPPSKYVHSNEEQYYILPTTVLEQCFGNPYIASSVYRFPEVAKTSLREMYHAQRWHDEFPAPMFIHDKRHIFLNDFVVFDEINLGESIGKVLKIFRNEGSSSMQLELRVLLTLEQVGNILPHMFIMNPNEDSLVLHDTCVISAPRIVRLCQPPRSVLRIINDFRLEAIDHQEYIEFTKQHDLKVTAAGYPVFIAPLVLFTDDTSGNRSKKWNKFDYWCLTLAGLPIIEARMFQNINFLTCSNRISAIAISKPLIDDLKQLEKGVLVYDACLREQVLIVAPVMAILGDNARASELVNHLGSRAKRFCRKCKATADDTTVGPLRSKSDAVRQMTLIGQLNSESERKRQRTEFGIKELPNPLFELSTDLYRSTPVETLHTILLGACKYMLRTFMGSITVTQKKSILANVKAWSYCGFDQRITGNIVHHYKSFVGRDFKAWLQMALFIIPPYVSDQEMKCWFALIKLFRNVYCLQPTDAVIEEISCLAQMFVDLITQYSPEYSKRLKVHILLHLADDIRDFGPSNVFNTERFESFNALVRNQNVFSNRHQPSKDICASFALLQHFRFLCSGGMSPPSSQVVGGVGDDLKILYKTPQVQKFLNFRPSSDLYSDKAMYQPGTLRKLKHGSKRVCLRDVVCSSFIWNQTKTIQDVDTEGYCLSFTSDDVAFDSLVLQYAAVVGSSCKLINVGNFVKLENCSTTFGILLAVFQSSDPSLSLCIVWELEQLFGTDGEELLSEFECPLLTLSKNLISVSSMTVVQSVSIVHQCDTSCSVIDSEFHHDYNNQIFSLNIYCIGNYH